MLDWVKHWDEADRIKFLKVFNELYNSNSKPSKEWQKVIDKEVDKSMKAYWKIIWNRCLYCSWYWYVSNWKTRRRCLCNPL